jgi:hypothetical protein
VRTAPRSAKRVHVDLHVVAGGILHEVHRPGQKQQVADATVTIALDQHAGRRQRFSRLDRRVILGALQITDRRELILEPRQVISVQDVPPKRVEQPRLVVGAVPDGGCLKRRKDVLHV